MQPKAEIKVFSPKKTTKRHHIFSEDEMKEIQSSLQKAQIKPQVDVNLPCTAWHDPFIMTPRNKK